MTIDFDPESHTYIVDGLKYVSVTTVIADMGLYGDAAAYFTEYSRTGGTYVHRLIQFHTEGTLDPDTVDPSLSCYLDAWKAFVSDTGFVSTETEKPLASEIYRFAGTPDHVGYFRARDGKDSCIDVKSGAVFPATQIQLAAYEILVGRPLKRFALCLKDTGKYSLREFKDRQDRGVFFAALTCWWWRNTNLKGRG